MKKIYLLFMVLILTLLISIPQVYAVPMPSNKYYTRRNSALNAYDYYYTGNISVFKYIHTGSEIFSSIGYYDTYVEPFVVVLSDLDLMVALKFYADNNFSLPIVISSLYEAELYENLNAVWFADYSDDDIMKNQFYALNQLGGQMYIYVYVRDTSVPIATPMFWISTASYNQVFNEIYSGSTSYQSGYDNGYNQGYNQSVIDNVNPAYNNGYDIGYDVGYGDGILADYSAWDDIMQGFFGPFNILNFELLPGFKIGYVFAFFMIIGVLSFLIGKRKA